MPATQQERYYGFQDTALLCEHVISTLFSVLPGPSTSPLAAPGSVGVPGIDTPPHSPPLVKDTTPNLGEFIAYALYRTRLPISITQQALLLLTRLKTRYPSARGTSTSPHRLFLSSLMLSSKISMDDSFSNKSWTIVGQGLFSLREVNQMERELFSFLGYNVVVRDEELTEYVKNVIQPYQQAQSASAATAVPRKSMEDRKRRRDQATNSSSASSAAARPPTPSCSRSPSPDSVRHRRASDAAIALLKGATQNNSNASLNVLAQTNCVSSAAVRSSRRTRSSTRSPYSTNSSRASSNYSSYTCSPISGTTTPGSPCTPAGPLTPDTKDHLTVAPSWTQSFHQAGKKISPNSSEEIQISSW